MTKKQMILIEAMVTNPYLNDSEVAAMCHVTQGWVSNLKQKPEFKEELRRRLKEEWQSAANMAQNKMIDLVKNGRDDVSVRAATYILDSNGYKPVEKIDANVTNKVIQVTIDDD